MLAKTGLGMTWNVENKVHTIVDLGVPAANLSEADTILGSKGVAVVSADYLVEAVAIAGDAWHSRGVAGSRASCGGRRLEGSASSS